jgi:hypothetical protein
MNMFEAVFSISLIRISTMLRVIFNRVVFICHNNINFGYIHEGNMTLQLVLYSVIVDIIIPSE